MTMGRATYLKLIDYNFFISLVHLKNNLNFNLINCVVRENRVGSTTIIQKFHITHYKLTKLKWSIISNSTDNTYHI